MKIQAFQVVMALCLAGPSARASESDALQGGVCTGSLDQAIRLDSDYFILRKILASSGSAAEVDQAVSEILRLSANDLGLTVAIAQARFVDEYQTQAEAITNPMRFGSTSPIKASGESFERAFLKLQSATQPATRPVDPSNPPDLNVADLLTRIEALDDFMKQSNQQNAATLRRAELAMQKFADLQAGKKPTLN